MELVYQAPLHCILFLVVVLTFLRDPHFDFPSKKRVQPICLSFLPLSLPPLFSLLLEKIINIST